MIKTYHMKKINDNPLDNEQKDTTNLNTLKHYDT